MWGGGGLEGAVGTLSQPTRGSLGHSQSLEYMYTYADGDENDYVKVEIKWGPIEDTSEYVKSPPARRSAPRGTIALPPFTIEKSPAPNNSSLSAHAKTLFRARTPFTNVRHDKIPPAETLMGFAADNPPLPPRQPHANGGEFRGYGGRPNRGIRRSRLLALWSRIARLDSY